MTTWTFRLKIPLDGRRVRTYPAWMEWPAHVIPYRWRWLHRRWAGKFGFFWLPCPLCDQPFGGHEWRPINGLKASIPDPTGAPSSAIGICPRCTRDGRGWDPR
jgi:hypothetical protein